NVRTVREAERQQRSADLRAVDQQHRRDRAEEYVQGLSKIAANVIEQQSNLNAERIAILRVLLCQTSLYRIHFRSRLRHTDIRLEPPNHLDSSVGTLGRQTNGFLLRATDGVDRRGARQPERSPEARRVAQVGKAESCWHHTDDGRGPVTARDGLADDVG